MENGQDPKLNVDKFIDDMLMDAIDLRIILREEGNKNDIKERITCLKYLNDIAKTYLNTKKVTTHDPDAAGSTVRKYASAFSKDATGVGKARRGRKPAAFAAVHSDAGGDDFESDDTAA